MGRSEKKNIALGGVAWRRFGGFAEKEVESRPLRRGQKIPANLRPPATTST